MSTFNPLYTILLFHFMFVIKYVVTKFTLRNIYIISAVSLSCRAPFYKIMVPTVDTVRYNLLVKALVLSQYPVLLTGPVGTGKTSVAQSVLQELDNKWAALTINMSSQVGVFHRHTSRF